MSDYLVGAMILAYASIALFFLRFWRKTGDRLFAAFSMAFWLMMVSRLAVALNRVTEDNVYYLYLFRLAAYLIILSCIIDKNWTRRVTPLRPPKSGLGAHGSITRGEETPTSAPGA